MSLLPTGVQRPRLRGGSSTPPIFFQEMLPTRVKSHLTRFHRTARAQTNTQGCWGEYSILIFLEWIGRTNHDERRRDEQVCCPRGFSAESHRAAW